MYAKPMIVALCSALLIPAGVSARQQNGQLTVVAAKNQVSYEKWSDRTAYRLSNSIRRTTQLYQDRSSTGYARVQFNIDDQGRPQAIALAQPSPSRLVNRLSIRAVKTMGTLLPLPQEVAAGSKFEAWILVANDAEEKDVMLNQLRADHRARSMAQAGGEQPVLIALR